MGIQLLSRYTFANLWQAIFCRRRKAASQVFTTPPCPGSGHLTLSEAGVLCNSTEANQRLVPRCKGKKRRHINARQLHSKARKNGSGRWWREAGRKGSNILIAHARHFPDCHQRATTAVLPTRTRARHLRNGQGFKSWTDYILRD